MGGYSDAAYELDEVLVSGERDALPGGFVAAHDRVGILGDIAAVDVPFSQTRYMEKTISTFYDPNQPLNGVLANNPSIRIGSPSPMYTDFSMRGVNMNGSHYYINGVPNMFNQTRSIPAYTLESVDIVSGPNTVLNGATFSNNGTNGTDAPAGLLNGVTKRATADPVTNYTQSFSGRSTWTEDIDFGRRFGEDKKWGVRVMGHHQEGELGIKGADVNDKSIYVNIDHQDEKSKTNIFAGYYDWKVDGGQRWLSASKVTPGHLASPDGDYDLSFAGQTKYNHGTLFTLNHTQKMNDSWSAFMNAGYSHYSEHKWDPMTGSLTLGNDGKLSGKFRDYVSDSKSAYWQAGVTNHSEFGKVKNDLSFAVDYFNYKSKSVSSAYAKDAPDNLEGTLWGGVDFNGKPISWSTGWDTTGYSKENAYGLTIADRMEIGKFSLYLAGQYRDSDYMNSSGKKISKSSFNPTFAVAYKPAEDMSVYASYAESYTRPVEVGKGYDNAGQIFEPIKNKQTEIGVKYQTGTMLHTLAYFDLNQASYIEEDSNGPAGKIYTQEGENRYKGLEYTVTGKIAPKWSVMGGLMYIDGKREHLAKGSEHLEGKYATGTPKWNGVLAAEYEANASASFIARMNYVGSSHVNDLGLKTPDYMLFDLGMKYKTEISSVPVTWSLMCYNVFGKDYWISRGTSVALGAPRTIMLSAQFAL